MSADALQFVPALEELGERVVDRIGVPRDSWEIAAQLEVMGMRDHDARAGYGMHDLFELAGAIERIVRSGRYPMVIRRHDPEEPSNRVLKFLRGYSAGLVFAAPMALQGAAMLLWGYGIWGSVDLDLEQGSAIALAFILSYIISGGFSQAIIRRGLFYFYQQEPALARWTAARGLGIALRAMIAALVPMLFLNFAFHVLPWRMAWITSFFVLTLGVVWLGWSVMYLVRQTAGLAVVTLAALGAVLLAARLFGAAPIVANGIGVIVAGVLSLGIGWFLLSRAARAGGRGEVINPPRFAVIVFSTARYFVYGLLANSFLFADRLLAWTVPNGRSDFPPYGFWLDVRYELGMDLALVVVIIMSGVASHLTESFSERLIPQEKEVESSRAASFAAEQLRVHTKGAWQLAAAAVAGCVIAEGLRRFLLTLANPRLHDALIAANTQRVFLLAGIAYVFFMYAMRDLLLLLTLSRVQYAVSCLAPALAVNVLVGFLCSRSIGYWSAVLGLLAGSIVLAILAARAARRVLLRIDYYYYSAF